MSSEDLCFMQATEIAAAIRSKKLSSVEVVNAFLDRIERINPKLIAYCTLTADLARAEAKVAEGAVMRGDRLGALHGVPMSIKDLTDTKGVRTVYGSKIWEHHVPDQDAVMVTRLKEAGAIMLGKTNTPEFGHIGATHNPVFGISRNPWNTDRTPGGSSGGAGAAVAAGLSPLAEGSDGGGSIRIPGSFCGIYGLKPSFGRIPRGPGSRAGWEFLAHNGPMTRTVRDAALMLDVMAGPDDVDRWSLPAESAPYARAAEGDMKGKHVAWSADLGYALVDPEVKEITTRAVKAFEELGCVVEEAHPDTGNPLRTFVDIISSEVYSAHVEELEKHGEVMTDTLVSFLKSGQKVTAQRYQDAMWERAVYSDKVFRFMKKYDFLVTPTLPVAAFKAGDASPKEISGVKVGTIDWIYFTMPFNLTGQPAATVPCGWTKEGLPVGLQIVGHRYDDAGVLRASACFEAARPWAHRRPPIG